MLRSEQSVFDLTGGVHAVAIFTDDAVITDISEDVGRHNAMDKIIGRSITDLPLSNHGFLLSGRVSFEMVQKAVMAGSPCIIAIGAPTTLAIDLARQHGITLIGFAREQRFNVYTGAWRLQS
jgi:FdhD protein